MPIPDVHQTCMPYVCHTNSQQHFSHVSFSHIMWRTSHTKGNMFCLTWETHNLVTCVTCDFVRNTLKVSHSSSSYHCYQQNECWCLQVLLVQQWLCFCASFSSSCSASIVFIANHMNPRSSTLTRRQHERHWRQTGRSDTWKRWILTTICMTEHCLSAWVSCQML